jgi:hypothetical protein
MVRIGDVWDSTMDAARGRAGVIAPVALIGFFVPGVLQNAVAAYGDPNAGSTAVLMIAVALIVLAGALWGQLTVIGIASDPATTRPQASDDARRRLLPALGVGLLMGLIAFVALLPFFIAMLMSGIDWTALSQPGAEMSVAMPEGAGGPILFAFFYLFIFVGLALWFGARVLLAYAVVLHERRGAGAIRRSLELTRGLTWKLLGVLLIYGIVLLVAMAAVQSVMFLLVRLPLGQAGASTATFLGAVAGQLVASVLVAVFCVFCARLYVALAGAPAARDVQPYA